MEVHPMIDSSSDAADRVRPRRRLVDAALVLAGGAAVAAGVPLAGVPLILLGVVSPVLVWAAGRRGEVGDVAALVPDDVRTAHGELLAAAALPGVGDTRELVAAANDSVIEVAALLCGRPPRGRTQERFVAARVVAFRSEAEQLWERHDALNEARAELDRLDPPAVVAAASAEGEPDWERGSGVLVAAFVVMMMPAFLAGDLARGLGRLVLTFASGVALRARTVVRLVLSTLAGFGRLLARSFRAWRAIRAQVVAAARDAHRQVVSVRLRIRLSARRARRLVRGP
jgi:hypothetical protein